MDLRPGSRLLLQLLQLLLVLQPVGAGAGTLLPIETLMVGKVGTDGDCAADNVHCFYFDSAASDGTLTLVNDVGDAKNAGAKEGVKLFAGADENREWIVYLMYDMSKLTDGKLRIGTMIVPVQEKYLGADSENSQEGDSVKFVYDFTRFANHFVKITIEPKDNAEPFLSDALKLYKEDKLILTLEGTRDGSTVKFTSNGAKPLVEYDKLCAPPTKDDAKPDGLATKASNDPNNKRKFTCDVTNIRFSDIFIGAKQSTGSGVVYCSANGWRDEDGKILGPYEKEHPYCWKTLPNIPIFSNCKQDEYHACFELNDDDNPSGMTVISAATSMKRGVEIDFTDPEKWIITVAWKLKEAQKCKFELSQGSPPSVMKYNFNCDPVAGAVNEGKSKVAKVVRVEPGRDGDIYQSKFDIAMTDNFESVSDLLGLYKGAQFTLTLVREGGGPISSPGFTAPIKEICTQETDVSPGTSAESAAHTLGTNLFTCPSTGNTYIFLNTDATIENSIYCSYKGWRKNDGKLQLGIPYSKQKVYCYSDNPTRALIPPMYQDCDKSTKYCYAVDRASSGFPRRIDKVTADPMNSDRDVGLVLDVEKDDEWFVILAHTKDECTVTIGSHVFKCGMDGYAEQDLGTVKVKQIDEGTGRSDKSLKFEKYRIKATNPEDPVVDALKFYENPTYKVGFNDENTPIKLESEEIAFFKNCESDTYDFKEKQVKKSTNAHNKYSCPDARYNQIFLNDENTSKNAVFCSKRGWRDGSGAFIRQHSREQAVCYSDNPPQPLTIYDDCDKEMCYTFDAIEPTKLVKITTKPTVMNQFGIELYTTKDMEWYLTMVWEGFTADCKFSIGPIKFECARSMDDASQEIGGVIIEKIESGKDLNVIYEKFKIKPKDAKEPVIDALRLYEKKEHALTLSGAGKDRVSPAFQFFQGCTSVDGPAPAGAIPATQAVNKHTCAGRLNQVFLNQQNMFANVPVETPTTVFCSKRGWRDAAHKMISEPHKQEKVLCYSDKPPQRLAVFEKCAAATKICYLIDDSTPPKLVPHKTDGKPAGDNPLGFELDTSDEKKWILTMVWEGFETGCKFSFETAEFECAKNKGESQTVLGVTIEKTDEGNDQYATGKVVQYEQYTIKSVNPDDPVVDALDLYKSPKYELKLTGPAGSIKTSDKIEFFKECVVTDVEESVISKKAQKATQTFSKFDCSAEPLLSAIYLKVEKKGTVLYCSKRGWRMGDGSFLVAFAGEQPYCYTEVAKSEMQMFTDCDSNKNRACYIFDNMPVSVIDGKDVDRLIPYRPPAALKYNLGFDLDFNGNLWTLIISYEKLDELKFQIGDLPVISIAGKNVVDDLDFTEAKVKYVEKGQDGTVFFHKFTIEPKNDGDSLIDSLELYEKKEYKIALHFKGKSLATDTGVTFFKQGCKAGSPVAFTFPSGAQIANHLHNKFECDSPKAIFINNEIFDGRVIYCSEQGWRNADKKLIRANAADESVYCFDLCTQEAMVVATADTTKPVESSSEYKCLDGKAAIKVNGNYYDAVKCEDNKWTGDGVSIPLAYDKDTKKTELYRFNAKCFGAFLFHAGNCNTDDLKKAGGCDQPEKDADEVLSCADGYVLTYNNIIYKSLKMEKGAWKDETGTEIEKADEEKIPKCLSKCNKDNVKIKGLEGHELTRDALYTWDQATNKGTLKCADKTDIIIGTNFESDKEKSYFSEWTCDAKNEWKINTGTEKKDLKSVTKTEDLKVTAHCFKACDDKKIVNGCTAEEPECKKFAYSAEKLSCAAHEVMYLVDDNNVATVQAKPLVCSAKAWKDEGGTLIHDHSLNKDVKITVQCVEKCASRFREGDDKSVKYSKQPDYRMSCDGYDMISYTIAGGQAVTTLKDLTCDKIVGWKAGAAVLIDFANGYDFKADCVTSCSDAWVKDDCAGRYKCEKPIVESDKIKCKEEGFLLYYHETPAKAVLEYNEIVCSKTDFTINGKTLPRVDLNTKISVECISKCDKEFVEISTLIAADMTKTDELLKCLKPKHYTSMTIGSKVYYTNDEFKCVPTTGWSATDLTDDFSPDEFLFDGSKHVSDATTGCFDYCDKRFKNNCPKPEKPDCKEPKYDVVNTKISCEEGYTMSYKEKDFIHEELTCEPQGYKRKNGEFVIDFTNTKVEEKFEIHCFANCKKDLVEIIKSTQFPQTGDLSQTQSDLCSAPDATCQIDQEIKCPETEPHLLVIETKASDSVRDARIFFTAKCSAESGWSGVVPKVKDDGTIETEDKQVVDFKKDVRITAACYKVCSSDAVVDDCDGEDKANKACGEMSYKKDSANKIYNLKCPENHRLFHKQKKASEYWETTGVLGLLGNGPLECTRDGWKDGATLVIDFKDPNVNYKEPVNALCRHKCNQIFVENSCKDDDSTCAKDAMKYDGKTLTCSHPSQIIVFEYTADDGAKFVTESFPATADSLATATCSDSGWKMGDEIIKLEKGEHYTIRARCEQLCSPNTLTEENKASRKYDLDGVLTCTETKEKLIFNGNDWYTDLTCSKDGWKSNLPGEHPTKQLLFTPRKNVAIDSYDKITYKAECVPSACYRDIDTFKPCGDDVPTEKCGKPNYESQKYFVECTSPAKIVKKSAVDAGQKDPIRYDKLKCDVNAGKIDSWSPWAENKTQAVFLENSGAMDLICHAGNCALCKDSLTKIPSGLDGNFEDHKYREGSATLCARYECYSKSYRVKDGVKADGSDKYKYYYEGAITCSENSKETYNSPDKTSTIGSAFSCVKQIPCIEHSPIDTTCSANFTVECDSEGLNNALIVGSKMDPKNVTCEPGFSLYLQKGANDWVNITLQCEKSGRWTASEPNAAAKELPSGENVPLPRVVCASQNPKTIVTTTTPPPGICTLCGKPPANEKDQEKITLNSNSDVCKDCCVAEIDKGNRFDFNSDKQSNDPLICKKEDKGHIWRSKDGTEIKSLAVVEPMLKGANVGMIVGIAIGVLFILGGIAGLLVFLRIRKKKEASRLETLKSKGLEIKNDSIIDHIEVDDPKTLIL